MKGIGRVRTRDGGPDLPNCTGMKHMASAKRSSRARGTSTRSRKAAATGRQFVVCVDNAGYEASLERNKIYVVLPDQAAETDGDVRVVDESGEDYLFSADRFVAIDVPAAVKASLETNRPGLIGAAATYICSVTRGRAASNGGLRVWRRHRSPGGRCQTYRFIVAVGESIIKR